VFARVATVLSEHDISIEAAIQRESAIRGTDEPWVPIVIVTHKVREQVVNKAIAAIKALDAVVGDITRIRVDHLT
jgi:homoserine dehydrogenase